MISSSRAKAKLLEGLKTTLVPSSSPSLCSGRASATSTYRSPEKRRIHFYWFSLQNYEGRRLTPANLFVHISTKEQPIGKITNSTDIQ